MGVLFYRVIWDTLTWHVKLSPTQVYIKEVKNTDIGNKECNKVRTLKVKIQVFLKENKIESVML